MYVALTVPGCMESRMALDRYEDGADGPRDVRPEQHRRHGGSAGDAPAARAEPAEPRTRAECYEALRAADSKPVHEPDNHDPDKGDHGAPDKQQDRSGWDTVDPGNRPPLDALRVTPERAGPFSAVTRGGGAGIGQGGAIPGSARTPPAPRAPRLPSGPGWHILDGDASGRGGHRHGVGNPGKTEFPASWDDKKIMDNVHDIARRPDQPPIYQAD